MPADTPSILVVEDDRETRNLIARYLRGNACHVATVSDGREMDRLLADSQVDLVVLDVDATIVIAHSEKEHAARTFKKTFGYHPIGVWCDNTGELLAATLRPGNAGSNTAADHTGVLSEAIAHIPAPHRKSLLIRVDGAGYSHELLDWITQLNTAKTHGRRGRSVQYSVGFAVTETIREAITRVPKRAWTPAMDTDGDVREHADIVEITGLLPKEMTEKWPTGMRVIVRREHPHPGAQLSLFEHADGWRYQAFATNTTTGQLAFLEARHRAHARVEDSIRHAKDTGLSRFPSREYGINTTWLLAVAIAADLTAWLRLLALPETLKTCEPKALRYRFLHIPARLTTSGRRRHLRLPETWPWTQAAVAAFTALCEPGMIIVHSHDNPLAAFTTPARFVTGS